MANLALSLTVEPDLPSWFSDAETITQVNNALNTMMHRERWKYTKAQPIIDLLPNTATLPKISSALSGVSVELVNRLSLRAPIDPDARAAPEATAALCYHDSVCVITVVDTPPKPLEIIHSGSSFPIVIKISPNTMLTLQETFICDVDQQQTLWIELAQGAQVLHSRNTFNKGNHWQFLRAHVNRDATYTLNNHVSGSTTRRQDMQIICAGTGAHADITSAACIETNCHLDQQITLEHQAANTTSNQIFHNIAGSKAKVTFNGRIHIHSQCPGVDAQLTNKNLSIGDNARINTKPELEIYTDDVKCAHGTTIGRLDDTHMFYCASRGLSPEQARTLLARAFLKVCTQGPLADIAISHFDAISGN